MREILPRKLWLGNSADARNIERIFALGILAVVDLAYEELPVSLPRSMVHCRFPLLDGQQASRQILSTAIDAVVALLKEEIPTLVYCNAGMSRSPAIVAAALTLILGGSPEERLLEILTGYPHDISPKLWKDIQEACKQKVKSAKIGL